MTKLTYDVFKMQMESFAVYLDTFLKKEVLDYDYWPIISRYDSLWFAEAVQWLKENYEYKRFPLISDFKKAFANTHRTKYIKEEAIKKEEPIDHEAYSKTILKFAEQFKTQEVKDKEKNKHRARKIYEKAKAEGRVWSYRLHKWVDRSLMNNIGGEFKLPEDVLY